MDENQNENVKVNYEASLNAALASCLKTLKMKRITNDKFKDEILSNFIPLDEVTISIPKVDVGDIIDYLLKKGNLKTV